jgi:hypothetical protein
MAKKRRRGYEKKQSEPKERNGELTAAPLGAYYIRADLRKFSRPLIVANAREMHPCPNRIQHVMIPIGYAEKLKTFKCNRTVTDLNVPSEPRIRISAANVDPS